MEEKTVQYQQENSVVSNLARSAPAGDIYMPSVASKTNKSDQDSEGINLQDADDMVGPIIVTCLLVVVLI
jgi:hypothetical protein